MRTLGEATPRDLPAEPRFIINATNLESGALFRFSRRYAADWRVGRIEAPAIRLATAVAASSAFPPVLSPFELDLRHADWETVPNELITPAYRGKLSLSDGGATTTLASRPSGALSDRARLRGRRPVAR